MITTPTKSLGALRAAVLAIAAVVVAVPAGAQFVAADIWVTNTDGVATVTPGTALTYTIVMTNNGPGPDGVMAAVSDTFPPQLTSITWTCTPSGTPGTACLVGSTGTGNIGNGTAGLPVGGIVTFLVHATVLPSATGTL